MIIFEQLRYKNFLSAGNQFTIIELNKYASTLVVGRNGAGKSTILDAICYALFAKPFRSVNKPQLVNSITRKNCLVELEFSIGAVKYMIRRGIKPAVFEVIKNGQMLNQSAESKDYQEILEKQILKLNYKSFCQIVILGSASFVPFMALTTGQRRAIIEDLLDLQIFTNMNVLLKVRVADNTKLILEINSRISLANEKIDLYNKHMVQVMKNNEELIAGKLDYIREKKANIVEMQTKIDAWQADIDEIEAKVSKEKYNEILIKKAKLKTRIEAKLSVSVRELSFLSDHDDCPTCQQHIDSIFKEEKTSELKYQIEKVKKGLEGLQKEIENYTVLCNEQKMQMHLISGNESNISQYQMYIQGEQNTIDAILIEIEKVKSSHYEWNGARIDEITAELKQAEAELEGAIEDRTINEAASVLLKDTGIKAKIIKQYVPIINKLINKYLSALDFFVQFELNEAFEETIKSRYRDEFSYESFSEGEKKRINLAIIFTWRAIAKLRNSANTNLFILDEVFDSSLDLTGTEDVLKLLLSLSAENTFIISHNPAAAGDKFSNVLKFEKKQSFSRIVSE